MQRTPTCRNCCRNYSCKVSPRQNGLNIPLLLDCGHTFCKGCLTKLARAQKTHIACPECAVPTTLSKEGEPGVKELSINIYIMGILMTNMYKKTLLESESPPDTGIPHQKLVKPKTAPDLKCEECFSASATIRCLKCECVFCVKCFEKVHSTSNALRKHKPSPLLSTSAFVSTNGCSIHDNRPFEYYDKDDNKPVCGHCVVTGERKMQNVVPIGEVAEDIKDHLQESLKTGKSILKHLETSQQKIRQVLSQDLSEKTNMVNEIREHFQLLNSALQVREEALVREVNSSQCQEETLEMGIAESIRKTTTLLFELEDSLRDPTTLINRSKEFIGEMQELQEMNCYAVKTHKHEDSSRFSYEEEYLDSIKTYGKVQVIETMRLEMMKLSDVSEEVKNDEQEDDDKQDKEEDQGELTSHGQRTHAARRILSIPYRHEMVQVTHIKDPSYFVVQRVADMDQLNVLMNVINKHCEGADPSDLVFEVNVGDVVCAQFSVDNHWYRARVMSVYSPSHPNTLPTIDNNLSVQVMYMDYGNTEWTPMIRLRSLPTKFLHVPDMAVTCCLDDIVPPFQQAEWPPKTIKAFGSLTGNKALLMTALRRGAGGILHVDLKCPDDDEPTHDDDRPASVRDALVFLEVARFKSPASQINVDGELPFPMRVFKNPPPVDDIQTIGVLVTHATGPHDIYIQLIEDSSTNELLQVMDDMYKYYSGKQKQKNLQVPWPYRGLVCGAQFTEDKAWYRALVIGVNSDDTVDVHYVDYGNAERLPFSAIRKLPDSFLGLPRQARKASLADIKPCNNEDWSDKVQGFVCNQLIGKPFLANIIGVNDGDMSVVLYDNKSITKEPSVNSLLVQFHFAEAAGLGIVKEHVENDNSSELEVKDQETEQKSLQDDEEKTSEQTLETNQPEQNFEEQSTDETDENSDNSSLDQLEPSPPEQKLESSPPEECLEPSPPEQKLESSPQEEKETSPLEHPSEQPVEPSPPVREPMTYNPAEIPITLTRQFQAGVTYVGMDGYIYVQEIKQDNSTLVDIMTRLNNKYKDGSKTSSPSSTNDVTIGQPCCARFTDDGMWYRATITKVMSINHVEVNYVDFGNSEIIDISSLRMDPPDLDLPKQCLQLVLYGVEPANTDGRWSMKAISVMSQLLVGKNCSAMIEGETTPGQPIQVRLCSQEGKNVSDTLLSLCLARSTDGVNRLDTSVNALPAGARRVPPSNSTRSTGKHPSRAETKLQAMLIGTREADQLLPSTQLPEVNMAFDVMVTHVDQADDLFIQRSPNCDSYDVYDIDPTLLDVEDELERLEEMAMNINKQGYFKKYGPLTQARQGMLCCGLYTEDNTWYRGQVLAVESENPLMALVRYIDYGNSEVLTGDRMRCFPSELLDLPIQATQCRLAHVRPPKSADPTSEGSSWPDCSKERLIELVVGKRLEARIVAYGSPISIELHDLSTGNIAKILSQQGHAIYKYKNNHDNDGNESLDTLSEGAPSQCSNDVEIEDEEIIETNGRVFEFKQLESDVTSGYTNKDELLDKVLSAKAGFAAVNVPLLTPNEFAVSKTADQLDRKDDDVTPSTNSEPCSHDNTETANKVNADAIESEV